jgi:UPF0271 protein
MDINLNADLGESFGPWKMGDDALMLGIVGSANIACGFHAGDPLIMRRTLHAAHKAGVSIGAHVAFPDLQGFGRRPMHLAPDELEAAILYQIAALAGLAQVEGARVTHVKPHGALSNMACEDAALAERVARAVRRFDRDLVLLAPACSALASAGERAGLAVALEVFADRTYTDAGHLVARREPGAVIATAAECATHVLGMLEAGGIVSRTGKRLPTPFHSICVHGDSAHAVATARTVRDALAHAGYRLQPLTRIALARG